MRPVPYVERDDGRSLRPALIATPEISELGRQLIGPSRLRNQTGLHGLELAKESLELRQRRHNAASVGSIGAIGAIGAGASRSESGSSNT